MKIIFLGTSYGAPDIGRHCQSILIEVGDSVAYLVDAGAPVIDVLVNSGYDMKKIKAIFITHLHGDHMNGLLDIQYLADVYKINCPVFLPEQRGIEFMMQYNLLQYGIAVEHRVPYRLVEKGNFFSDDYVKIEAVCSGHLDVAYGYKIEADHKKIYITGDLSNTLEEFSAIPAEEKVDMLITECAHFGVDMVLKKIPKYYTQKVAFVHVFPHSKYEELSKSAGKVPYEILLPTDGDTYSV